MVLEFFLSKDIIENPVNFEKLDENIFKMCGTCGDVPEKSRRRMLQLPVEVKLVRVREREKKRV